MQSLRCPHVTFFSFATTYHLIPLAVNLPYLVVDFPSEAAAVAVCNRGVLTKSVIELWAEATNYEGLVEASRQVPPTVSAPHFESTVSWSCHVDAFGLSYSLERQAEIRCHLKHLPFQGPVRCKDPDQTFWIIERHDSAAGGAPVPTDSKPARIYFGREVARSASRRLVSKCDLKKRPYLGPTSMDNELSLVMANMALVRKGSVVLDPFVGTGSILRLLAFQCFLHGYRHRRACAPRQGWEQRIHQF